MDQRRDQLTRLVGPHDGALRLEKQYLAWATDMRSDNDPYEVGLGFCVKLAKPDLLAGPALKAVKEAGPERRLRWFTTDSDVVMHGGEMPVHTATDTRAPVRSGAVNLVGAQRDRGVQGLDGRVSVIWVRLRQSVR